LYRGINDFKKSYQPRNSIVINKRGDSVTEPHGIVDRWKNYFSHILNVHEGTEVKQTEIQVAEPLVPEPGAFEAEMAIENLKGLISPQN
jgi:hypothetical protein